ncbi:MAG TPA: cation-translocating P-type ATPase [Thermoanaerobaculia bacterium]|nr:cation-translocating P-type ATPase [Thermoanaerobaculia bacterium]
MDNHAGRDHEQTGHDHNHSGRDHDRSDHGSDYTGHDHEHGVERADLIRIAFVGLAILAVWQRVWEPFAGFSVIGLAATLIGGYPIFAEALSNLAARRMTMELSMTIALVAALAIGELVTTLVIVFFVLIAEVLEGLTVGRGRNAIKHLVDLLPRRAVVRDAAGTREVEAAAVGIGDVVVVKPGSRLPVDGVVVAGDSFVDQSPITGESVPVEKTAGAEVYAGTINQAGALEVRVTGSGRDTAFGRIVEAVEQADKLRAPIQKTADRLAGYLVYFAIGCAALTYLVTRDMRSTIAVVIVAGACGIAAGTPLAVLGAIGRAARQGAIIKGGIYLEALGKVDTVVLDKTGTLTMGELRVTAVRAAPGVGEEAVIAAAAVAERRSEHPLAKAILDRAGQLGLAVVEPERFDYTPGKGIACTVAGETILVGNEALLREHGLAGSEGFDLPAGGDELAHSAGGGGLAAGAEAQSWILVARGGQVLGALAVADTVRPEAAEAVGTLRNMGIRTVLLTGDTAAIARAVGEKLGIDEVHAGLLPQEKVTFVESLRTAAGSGRRAVAMIGDGINDAPALIAATVGVAMGAGTDVARESSDVVLIGNDLLKFVETVRIARWCRRIILTNFTGTLVVDGIGVGLAAAGLLNPLLAALIHVSSELVFILNSARLLPAASRQPATAPPLRAAAAPGVAG